MKRTINIGNVAAVIIGILLAMAIMAKGQTPGVTICAGSPPACPGPAVIFSSSSVNEGLYQLPDGTWHKSICDPVCRDAGVAHGQALPVKRELVDGGQGQDIPPPKNDVVVITTATTQIALSRDSAQELLDLLLVSHDDDTLADGLRIALGTNAPVDDALRFHQCMSKDAREGCRKR